MVATSSATTAGSNGRAWSVWPVWISLIIAPVTNTPRSSPPMPSIAAWDSCQARPVQGTTVTPASWARAMAARFAALTVPSGESSVPSRSMAIKR